MIMEMDMSPPDHLCGAHNDSSLFALSLAPLLAFSIALLLVLLLAFPLVSLPPTQEAAMMIMRVMMRLR